MIFRNHNNILIRCSRNINDYINAENSCAAEHFCGNCDIYISAFFDEKNNSFETDFCNIINVFTVTFDSFNE